MDFALKFGGEDQKNKKKGHHRKILSYLITFTRSVLLFRVKKALVVTCFRAKVCWSSSTSTKVYSRSGGKAVIWGARPKPPLPRAYA